MEPDNSRPRLVEELTETPSDVAAWALTAVCTAGRTDEEVVLEDPVCNCFFITGLRQEDELDDLALVDCLCTDVDKGGLGESQTGPGSRVDAEQTKGRWISLHSVESSSGGGPEGSGTVETTKVEEDESEETAGLFLSGGFFVGLISGSPDDLSVLILEEDIVIEDFDDGAEEEVLAAAA